MLWTGAKFGEGKHLQVGKNVFKVEEQILSALSGYKEDYVSISLHCSGLKTRHKCLNSCQVPGKETTAFTIRLLGENFIKQHGFHVGSDHSHNCDSLASMKAIFVSRYQTGSSLSHQKLKHLGKGSPGQVANETFCVIDSPKGRGTTGSSSAKATTAVSCNSHQRSPHRKPHNRAFRVCQHRVETPYWAVWPNMC